MNRSLIAIGMDRGRNRVGKGREAALSHHDRVLRNAVRFGGINPSLGLRGTASETSRSKEA
jgi:hypothetical protein